MDKFKGDINEIIALIVACTGNQHTANKKRSTAVDNICEITGVPFLDERATAISLSYKIQKILQNAMAALDEMYCLEKKCSTCPVSKYCNGRIKVLMGKVDYSTPVIVDLFCGAGGLSLGFAQEGYRTSLANDIEPCCIATYAHNHPETPREHIVLGDINNVIDNLESLLRFKDVDVVIGGPPCQGFSMANRQRLIDDPRNKLYKSFVSVVAKIAPAFFVMENVKGMLSVSEQILEDFRSVGYTVSCRILNAKDFGIPQNRERIIFIGNRVGVDNNLLFDELEQISNESPQRTLADALFGLRPLAASRVRNATDIDCDLSGAKIERHYVEDENEYIYTINQARHIGYVCNHKARYNNDRDVEIFGRLHQGDRSDDPKIADIMPYTRRNDIFKDKYFKLESNKVCKTITAHMKFDCNMYIHPTQARGLTPREAARIQSYPDDYFFCGAYTKTYMQIGNSVPPLLGRAIAQVIKPYLARKGVDH